MRHLAGNILVMRCMTLVKKKETKKKETKKRDNGSCNTGLRIFLLNPGHVTQLGWEYSQLRGSEKVTPANKSVPRRASACSQGNKSAVASKLISSTRLEVLGHKLL